MKKSLALLIVFALVSPLLAQRGVIPVQIRVGATDPVNCTPGSVPGERNLFYNSTSSALKQCTATDTWTTVGAGSGTVTAGATTGCLAYYAAAGTTVSCEALVTTDALGTITGVAFATSGSNGGIGGTEGTGANANCGANKDCMYPDSTKHRMMYNNNNSGAVVAGANPFTVAGDIIYGGTVANGVGPETRLGIGTAIQVLHGGATAPSYTNVLAADFGSAITARTVFGNATASAAAPAFGTTADALAYQTAEMPFYVFVTGDFTTSGSGTALEAITGLTWTIPATTAINIPFSCRLIYHQNNAAVAVAFGIQMATNNPTQINAVGLEYTNVAVVVSGNLVGLATTTATAIVSGTPSAITTNWDVFLDGMIEAPSSGSGSAVTIRTSTATAADTVTVKRGSFCRIG